MVRTMPGKIFYEWSTADMMTGKMIVGGPYLVKYCPNDKCSSPNIRISGKYGEEVVKCGSCGATYGGASARV